MPSTVRTLLLILIAMVFAGAVRAQNTPANVIFMISDDQAHTAMGCAGNSAIQTPGLDRLAAEGVRFTDAFTPNPICGPARACVLTGQDTWTNGSLLIGTPIRRGSVQWAQLLSRAGYQTFYTGKWHNDGLPWERGFTHAEHVYVGGGVDHAALPVISFGQSRAERKPLSEYSSTAFVNAAIRFLEQRDKARPFAIYLSFTTPHDPWIPPGEYATMYDPADMPIPPNFMPTPPFKYFENFPALRDQSQLPWPASEHDAKRTLTQYYGSITHMDHQIGRLLDALDQMKLTGDTLVIFTSDHGYSMGSHGFVGKQTMYEEGIRVPMLVRYPRLRRGESTSDAMVSLIDIFPTICEAAGVSTPGSIEGVSMLDLYQGRDANRRTEVFASFPSQRSHRMNTRCIRTQRHKLIHHLLTDEIEVFDLQRDPHELRNVAFAPEYDAVREAMMDRLLEWRSTAPEK